VPPERVSRSVLLDGTARLDRAQRGEVPEGRLRRPSNAIVAVGLGIFRPLPNDVQGTETPHRNLVVLLARPQPAFTLEFQTAEPKRNVQGLAHHLLLAPNFFVSEEIERLSCSNYDALPAGHYAVRSARGGSWYAWRRLPAVGHSRPSPASASPPCTSSPREAAPARPCGINGLILAAPWIGDRGRE
jgi:hypothetical protein